MPDFLASRLSGSLDDLEQAVILIEQADSMEWAANALRADDIMLPGASAEPSGGSRWYMML